MAQFKITGTVIKHRQACAKAHAATLSRQFSVDDMLKIIQKKALQMNDFTINTKDDERK